MYVNKKTMIDNDQITYSGCIRPRQMFNHSKLKNKISTRKR